MELRSLTSPVLTWACGLAVAHHRTSARESRAIGRARRQLRGSQLPWLANGHRLQAAHDSIFDRSGTRLSSLHAPARPRCVTGECAGDEMGGCRNLAARGRPYEINFAKKHGSELRLSRPSWDVWTRARPDKHHRVQQKRLLNTAMPACCTHAHPTTSRTGEMCESHAWLRPRPWRLSHIDPTRTDPGSRAQPVQHTPERQLRRALVTTSSWGSRRTSLRCERGHTGRSKPGQGGFA